MPLSYSSKATIALAEFYSHFNEKKIFVEDEGGRLIHERIIAAIIGSGRIVRVFPLNGRDPILNDWQNNKNDKNKIYIIDGDMEVIYPSIKPKDNLFILDRYCIENFIFDEFYVRKVLEDYVRDHDALEQALTDTFSEINLELPHFVGLFVLYALCQRHSCGIQTVKEGALRFFSEGKISRRIIFCRKRELLKIITKKIGLKRYKAEKKFIIENIKTVESPYYTVSAKDFLFPILHKIAVSKYGYVGKRETFIKMCSRYFKPEAEGAYEAFLLKHFPKSG